MPADRVRPITRHILQYIFWHETQHSKFTMPIRSQSPAPPKAVSDRRTIRSNLFNCAYVRRLSVRDTYAQPQNIGSPLSAM